MNIIQFLDLKDCRKKGSDQVERKTQTENHGGHVTCNGFSSFSHTVLRDISKMTAVNPMLTGGLIVST